MRGLPNNVIYSIEEDAHGNLWLSTNKGICKFNPETENVPITICVMDWWAMNSWSTPALKSMDGVMYFGCNSGYNSFWPDSIRKNEYIPKVVLTDVKIFDQSVFFFFFLILPTPWESICLANRKFIFHSLKIVSLLNSPRWVFLARKKQICIQTWRLWSGLGAVWDTSVCFLQILIRALILFMSKHPTTTGSGMKPESVMSSIFLRHGIEPGGSGFCLQLLSHLLWFWFIMPDCATWNLRKSVK